MEIKWKSCLKLVCSIVLVYVVIHYCGNIEEFVKLGISAALPLVIGGVMAYAGNNRKECGRMENQRNGIMRFQF